MRLTKTRFKDKDKQKEVLKKGDPEVYREEGRRAKQKAKERGKGTNAHPPPIRVEASFLICSRQ
jgi:hypothetical protein